MSIEQELTDHEDHPTPAPSSGVRQGLSGFWMVWADNGRSSRKVHVTETSALREARRLAIKVPGTRFHVLHAYTSFRVSPPKPEAPLDPDFIEAA